MNITVHGNRKNIFWQYQIKDKSADEKVIELFDDEDLENEERRICTYTEDVLGDWKSLFEYIDELMNFKGIDELYFNLDDFPDLNQPMIECLKTWNKPVGWLELHSENQADDMLKQLLRELTITGTLNIFAKFSENFQLTIPKLSGILCFDDAKWINFNQLFELDARYFRLEETNFTDLELIAFFQSWMSSESHLNLQIFEIRIKEESVFETIFQELPHEVVSFWFWRNYSNGPKRINVPFGIAITRNDGKVGRIFVEQQWEGNVWLKFLVA
ncbi:hypothetical protein CAEBREN_23427 [Caenorhabditis brenneri]|uniref:Sdz-33 F-box domain-containing protein n=1 Tax=Caenorhabditis brenneri TaxID=135651 RepID=G0P3P8_CAEBE|nr:hypothetical protein CAEBREN_23427 [Caenorhabditis brenneri]